MKKISIILDDQTVAWTRVQAAERNMSVSRFISELLGERMRKVPGSPMRSARRCMTGPCFVDAD